MTGLLIATKHKVTQHRFDKFANTGSWEERLFVRKGFITALVEMNGYKIGIVDTHTAADTGSEELVISGTNCVPTLFT